MSELDIKYNEIEDLDYCLKLLKKRDKKIKALEKIIKKVRDYIITTSLDIYNYYKQDYIDELITEYNDKLLDILNKVDKGNK